MAIYAGIFLYEEQGSVKLYWQVNGKPEAHLSYKGIAGDLRRLESKSLRTFLEREGDNALSCSVLAAGPDSSCP